MAKPRYTPEYQELLDYYEEKRRNGTELEGLVPVTAKVAKNPGAIFSVRFNMGELGVVEKAAEVKGMKLGAFIREAALNAAVSGAEDPPLTQVNLSPSEQEILFQALRRVISTSSTGIARPKRNKGSNQTVEVPEPVVNRITDLSEALRASVEAIRKSRSPEASRDPSRKARTA